MPLEYYSGWICWGLRAQLGIGPWKLCSILSMVGNGLYFHMKARALHFCLLRIYYSRWTVPEECIDQSSHSWHASSHDWSNVASRSQRPPKLHPFASFLHYEILRNTGYYVWNTPSGYPISFIGISSAVSLNCHSDPCPLAQDDEGIPVIKWLLPGSVRRQAQARRGMPWCNRV